MLEAEHWRAVEAQSVFVVHVWPPPPETHWPEELQLSAGPGGGGGGGGGGVIAAAQLIVTQPAVNLPAAKVLMIVLIRRYEQAVISMPIMAEVIAFLPFVICDGFPKLKSIKIPPHINMIVKIGMARP